MISENFSLGMVRCWNRSCECPVSGGDQGQVGWGPGQPELREWGGGAGEQPHQKQGIEIEWALRFLLIQAILWFYDMSINVRFCVGGGKN